MGCEKLKKKTSNLAKLERNRFSVFTDNLGFCYFCGLPRQDLHELLGGRNRLNSMKYGYVLPLCRSHHNMLHNNVVLIEEWKRKSQEHFEESHSRDEWLEVFKKNYL